MILTPEQHELLKEIVQVIRLERISEQTDTNGLITQRVFKVQDDPMILLVYKKIDNNHDWYIQREG